MSSDHKDLRMEILSQFKELNELIPTIQDVSLRCLLRDISRELVQTEIPQISSSDRLRIEKDVISNIFNIFKGKWVIDILFTLTLLGDPHFNDLQKAIPKIGSKILIERLKHLENRKVINRNVITSQPVRVTYSLSKFGISLISLLFPLIIFCIQYEQLKEDGSF